MQWARRSPVTPLPATFSVEAPQALAALRQILGDRPVLEELRAVVEDAPELPLIEETLEQDHRRHAPVVVPDRVRDTRGLDGRDHRRGLDGSAAERLLAHHHLAGLGGRDGDVVMRVVGARDVDEVDVLPLDQLAPVGFDRLVAPVGRERLGAVGVARAERLEYRLERKVEIAWRLQKRVRVRAPHEAVAYKADVEGLHHAPCVGSERSGLHAGPATCRFLQEVKRSGECFSKTQKTL